MSNQQIRVTLTGDSTGLEAAGGRGARTMEALVRSSGNAQRTLVGLNETTSATGRQMALLVPQLNDVAVSLAGGQNPMLVFLQQGMQIRDVMGGWSQAGSALMSMLSAKTLVLGGLAASVAVLGKAYTDGLAQTERYRDMQALTGGAIGITRSQFEALIETSAAAANATVQDARAIAEALGSTGRVGGEALGTLTTAALRYQAVSGKSAQDVSGMFAEMARDAYAWASRNNESMNFATSGQLQAIRAMREAGDQQGALIATGELLISHWRSQGENLGWLERMIRGTSQAWSSFKDALSSIGRPDTTATVLQGLRQELSQVQAAMRGMNPDWDGVALNGARRQEAALQRRIADIEGNERDARVRAGNRAVQAREEQERTERLNKLREATERLSGANSQYVKDLKAIEAAGRAGDITQEEQQRLLTELAIRNAPAKPRATRDKAPPEDYLQQADNRVRDAIEAWQVRDIQAIERADERSRRDAERIAIDSERNRQRAIEQAAQMGDQLTDQAASINAQLITDDERRAAAQLEIERQAIQRRIDLLAAAGADVRALEDALAGYVVARRAEANEALKPQWRKLLEGWQDNNRLMRDSWNDLNLKLIQGSEDAWVELIRTGKFSAGRLVDMVLTEMARIQFRKSISPLLGSLLDTVGDSLGLSLGGGSAGTVSGGSGLKLNALGGVYASRSLSAYSSTVVDKPTLFAFARGAGLMGEAGPEGILPLKRNSRGQLGVIATNAGQAAAAGNVYVSVENNAGASVQTETKTAPNGDQFVRFIIDAAASEVDRRLLTGGSTSRALTAGFGIQRRPPARS